MWLSVTYCKYFRRLSIQRKSFYCMDAVRADRVLFWYLHSLAFCFFSISVSRILVSGIAIGNGSLSMRFDRVCDIKNASICNVAMHTEHSLHTVFHGFYYTQFEMLPSSFIMSGYLFDLMPSNQMESPDVRHLRCSFFLSLWLLSSSFGIVAVGFFLLFAQDQIWKNASFWPVTLRTSMGIHIALESVVVAQVVISFSPPEKKKQ